MTKLYSVACERAELYQVRVRADNEEDAKREARHQFDNYVISEPYGYVGFTIRTSTVIEVEDGEILVERGIE